jgi:hypothetical protein
MRLRTQIDACLPRGTVGDIEHDAMAAQALLQAMDEYDPEYRHFKIGPVANVKKRAAEILAGWLGEE